MLKPKDVLLNGMRHLITLMLTLSLIYIQKMQ